VLQRWTQSLSPLIRVHGEAAVPVTLNAVFPADETVPAMEPVLAQDPVISHVPEKDPPSWVVISHVAAPVAEAVPVDPTFTPAHVPLHPPVIGGKVGSGGAAGAVGLLLPH
jgi:hypothetical protein